MTRPAFSTPRVFILWVACAQVLLTPSRASPGACELINYNSCLWLGHHVNTTANVARRTARPAAGTGSQPDSLRCAGFFSPSLPSLPSAYQYCVPLLEHLEAWEVLLPADDLLRLLHDLPPAGSSAMTHDIDTYLDDFAPSPSAPGSSLDVRRDDCGREHDRAVCPLTSISSCASALTSAPAPHPRLPRLVTLQNTHSNPSRSRMGRRSPGADTEHPSAHFPAHPDPGDTLDAPSSGSPRSVLGAVYDSYALWELASFVSAIAWLLVCLAA